MARTITDASDAYKQMEAVILRQLLSASGAFKPSEVAGGQLRADMFIETLADAVAHGGGIGIARMLEDSMGQAGQPSDGPSAPRISAPRPAVPSPSLAPSPSLPLSPSSSKAHATVSLAPELHGQVTSGFGDRADPIDGTTRYHTGIDLRAAEGSPIRVAGGGTVRSAGPRGGYGNAVEIDHGGGVTTLYAHASELLVKPGENVSAGQEIARVGQTGRATGPHLHFEVRRDNHPVDPTQYAGVVHRALNAYQRRAEDTVTGNMAAPSRGDAP